VNDVILYLQPPVRGWLIAQTLSVILTVVALWWVAAHVTSLLSNGVQSIPVTLLLAATTLFAGLLARREEHWITRKCFSYLRLGIALALLLPLLDAFAYAVWAWPAVCATQSAPGGCPKSPGGHDSAAHYATLIDKVWWSVLWVGVALVAWVVVSCLVTRLERPFSAHARSHRSPHRVAGETVVTLPTGYIGTTQADRFGELWLSDEPTPTVERLFAAFRSRPSNALPEPQPGSRHRSS
jgi:hypothetical protein